jgi:hypothetical protein
MLVTIDESSKLPDLPCLPSNRRIGTTFLVLDDTPGTPRHRQPDPDIAGKTKMMGDTRSSAAEDWYPRASFCSGRRIVRIEGDRHVTAQANRNFILERFDAVYGGIS